MNDDDFKPDWYSPPGDTILECMNDRGIFEDTLAQMIGKDAAFVRRLVAGDERITPELAYQLSIIFGASEKFWLAREARYRYDKARLTGESL